MKEERGDVVSLGTQFIKRRPKGSKSFRLKPIFHCDAKYLASGVGVGQCPRRQNFALDIPTCWYILALPNAKIWSPLTPNLKFALPPTPTPNASQWNIGGVGLLALAMYISCIFHVYFMLFVHHFPRWLREN